jgi:phenylalanine-4-hydroxylase
VLTQNELTKPFKINYFCAYVGRKDRFEYKLTHDEIMQKYGHIMRFQGEVPVVFSRAMGQKCYIFSSKDQDEMLAICNAILEKT